MTAPAAPHEGAADNRPVGARIRSECIRRGWDLQEFADRAGLSRTTVYNLEHGRTARPHPTTFGKLAALLDLPVDELLAPQWRDGASPESTSFAGGHGPSAFDVATNPAVTDVMRERPELFAGWDRDDVAELYSLFGVGGELNHRGVVCAAEAINRKRETIRKLHVVLETHLRERAIDLIDLLYDLVRVPAGGGCHSKNSAAPDSLPGR
jgi:transcriptional regulator with XRE-family HTH domain